MGPLMLRALPRPEMSPVESGGERAADAKGLAGLECFVCLQHPHRPEPLLVAYPRQKRLKLSALTLGGPVASGLLPGHYWQLCR